MKKITFAVVTAVFATILIYSCDKDDYDTSSATVSVYLHDDPAAYDKVKIHIKGVQVFDDSSDTWVTLTVNDSIYDILTLDSLNPAYLGKFTITETSISQVRLMVGSQDSVVIGGVSYPIVLDSADVSKLKVSVDEKLNGGSDYQLTIDFKASESIDQDGDVYYLKASLKIKIKEI